MAPGGPWVPFFPSHQPKAPLTPQVMRGRGLGINPAEPDRSLRLAVSPAVTEIFVPPDEQYNHESWATAFSD